MGCSVAAKGAAGAVGDWVRGTLQQAKNDLEYNLNNPWQTLQNFLAPLAGPEAAAVGIVGKLGVATEAEIAAAKTASGMEAAATKGVAGETRFINGVKVTDRATGNVLQGTVDLKPTLDRIAAGKSFPHRNDGAVFGNKEGLLPQQPAGYYREYVHPTPGVNGPGPQRIVTGQGGEVFYTPNHYGTFIPVRP